MNVYVVELLLAAVSADLLFDRAAIIKGLSSLAVVSLSLLSLSASLGGEGAGILNENTDLKLLWCFLLLFFFFLSFVRCVHLLALFFRTCTRARHLSLSLAIFCKPFQS